MGAESFNHGLRLAESCSVKELIISSIFLLTLNERALIRFIGCKYRKLEERSAPSAFAKSSKFNSASWANPHSRSNSRVMPGRAPESKFGVNSLFPINKKYLRCLLQLIDL